MRCPEDTQGGGYSHIFSSWRAEVEEPGALPLLWGKVVPSKELCNQPMAQPLVLPALLTACPGDDGASNQEICLGKR